MIQKRWALRHKLGQKGPLSFTPAHKHKIRAVMHNVGKRIPHKNLLLSIPQSLVFIYITFSHLQHPKNSTSNTSHKLVFSKKECTSPQPACTLTIPNLKSISSARRKLSRALLLPNPHGRSVFPLCKFLSFSFSTVHLFCCLLVSKTVRMPLTANIFHTKYTWDAKGPSSADITCGWIIL